MLYTGLKENVIKNNTYIPQKFCNLRENAIFILSSKESCLTAQAEKPLPLGLPYITLFKNWIILYS